MDTDNDESPWGKAVGRGSSERARGHDREKRTFSGPKNRGRNADREGPRGRSDDRDRRDEPRRDDRFRDRRDEPRREVKPRVARRGKDDEWLEPVCGLHAVGTVFHCKPFAVERLFFDAELSPMLGEICKFLAKERKPYRQVEADELARVGGTRHHGGVVAVVKRKQPDYASTKAAEFWAKEGTPMLLLDGVSNSHNLGGVARTAAYFGIEKFLIAETRQQARPTESAYRVARGGLDMVDLRLVENVPSFIKGVRKSHFVVGFDVESPPLPELLAICPEEELEKPVMIVLGNEETGLSEATRAECSALVGIPGSGAIDRLNVVAEAALMIQKYIVEAY